MSLRRPSLVKPTIENNGELNYGFSDKNEENLYRHERNNNGPVYTSKYLQPSYSFGKKKGSNILKDSFNYVKKYYMPNANNCRTLLYRRIPPLQWIKEYDIKQNLLKDVVGGITVNFSKNYIYFISFIFSH
jgi:hypothetical protein